ncbi:P-loop containing nucleoside triphosphate hydrolase protein [Mycena metata]|uniref:P-loop containing nucleoside triphosphate hydrolase protein n=1 Tax=Mycena metata TaxID=1033252 RepID=A0AAD7I1G3_9AGAR|nr:P-loop containing nucleoside triphosphate hydrolase protein [Mycena metata]
MSRRFPQSLKAVGSSSIDNNDNNFTAAHDMKMPLPSSSSKIKQVDYSYLPSSGDWVYKDMRSKVTLDSTGDKNDEWKDYIFVLVRTIPRQEGRRPTFKLVIKCEYLRKACQDVIQTWPGVSWNANSLELEAPVFLTWYQSFIDYRDGLVALSVPTEQETEILSSVNLLLSFLESSYGSTLVSIQRLTAHGEITFDLLCAILMPHTLVIARCPFTGLERLFELQSFSIVDTDGPTYRLALESIDLAGRAAVGRVVTTKWISYFQGARRIDQLAVYPLTFHGAEAQLREEIKERGRKWVELIGVHHKQYIGHAACASEERRDRNIWRRRLGIEVPESNDFTLHYVTGRVMVDGETFRRLNANYEFPAPATPKSKQDLNGDANEGAVVPAQADATTENADLSPDDLLLTPTVVYGFSLSNKLWFEFDVTKIMPVKWNPDAFANLVLPSSRKMLLRSLVEAHSVEVDFDDFVKGKGAGLVVNLFGPPGVGKTLSAEATSEHLKRPLYVLSSGDLGESAADAEEVLERAFNIATTWKAVVLIDEADVFLERRSLEDLGRNAMVATFLRHLEYYSGILFLTTNRVQTFDEAFLSRIHVALHFPELSEEARAQIWRAFAARAGVSGIDDAQIAMLAKRKVNGRQIKNAVKTARSLALARKETAALSHFMETLDAMVEFTEQFEATKAAEENRGR